MEQSALVQWETIADKMRKRDGLPPLTSDRAFELRGALDKNELDEWVPADPCEVTYMLMYLQTVLVCSFEAME
jgi:hypothetical protein